ncbi:MAG: hypothetical protein ACOY71_13955 [Gemmatimonadota bacterium]
MSRRIRLIIGGILVAPVLLIALYTLFVTSWSYSEGTRAGVLQKFSRKGWVCKTFEGELAMTTTPGVAPVIWSFSARRPQAIAALEQAVGKQVTLHYSEHRGVPTTCLAETPYWVDSVRITP